MCGSLDACACCRLVSANVCTLTVIEKFTVPGEHREAFGFNKKSFKTMRLRTSPTPSGTLLSGRGEPAAATAARRHHYLRSQASTHPNQASENRNQLKEELPEIILFPKKTLSTGYPEDHRSPTANTFCAGGPI